MGETSSLLDASMSSARHGQTRRLGTVSMVSTAVALVLLVVAIRSTHQQSRFALESMGDGVEAFALYDQNDSPYRFGMRFPYQLLSQLLHACIVLAVSRA